MEETISLKEIFEVLKKRMLLIITLIIGAATISGVISYFVLTPTYQSSSQFIVNQKVNAEAANLGIDYNQLRSSIEIINTYNVIIKSPIILEDVAEETDFGLTADQLAGKIAVGNTQDAQVVNVTVTDNDPAVAAEIANTTVEVFMEKIPTIMNVDNVSILSKAEVPANPQQVSPQPMLNIAIAMVVGAMVGIGIAFLLEYLDNTVKTEADIEQKLEMPILGIVSHVDEKDLTAETANSATLRSVRGREHNGQGKKTI